MYHNVSFIPYGDGWQGGNPDHNFYQVHHGEGGFFLANFGDLNLIQYTGKKCFGDREVYEGDILFYEEEEDDGDKRYYLVVTWIEEWCMFATLHLDEYRNYKTLNQGVECLDEVMFWTYTIHKSEQYHYAGNIYETPELLNKEQE